MAENQDFGAIMFALEYIPLDDEEFLTSQSEL